MARVGWPATCECAAVKPNDLPPTRVNLIGTVVWAVLLSFSAVVNGVLSWQGGDSFIAWASAAQLLVTLSLVALTVARWRKRRSNCLWSRRISDRRRRVVRLHTASILRFHPPADRFSVIELTGWVTLRLEGCEKAKVALAAWTASRPWPLHDQGGWVS